MLYKSGQTYSINSCGIIEMFYNIRTDLDKLKYASMATKIVNDVTTENQNSYRILQLFLNTIYMITEIDEEFNFIISVFKIRLLSIIGYRPNIEECKICKDKQKLTYFSIKDDSLKCSNCGKSDKSAIEITETTKDAIRYIILAEAKRIFSFTISKQSMKELEIISKVYLDEKLEKEYKL